MEVFEFVEVRELFEFVEVRELLLGPAADGIGGAVGDVTGGLANAEAAGTLREAPAAPGYWIVFEGSVEVDFDLSDGTGFGDKLVGFRGSAGVCVVRERGGLPEDIPLWVLLLSRTR